MFPQINKILFDSQLKDFQNLVKKKRRDHKYLNQC